MQQPPNIPLLQSDCEDEGRGWGVGGYEQSHTEVRADFRNDPGIVERWPCQRRFGFSYELPFLCMRHTRVFSAIHLKWAGIVITFFNDSHKPGNEDRGAVIYSRVLYMFCLVSWLDEFDEMNLYELNTGVDCVDCVTCSDHCVCQLHKPTVWIMFLLRPAFLWLLCT